MQSVLKMQPETHLPCVNSPLLMSLYGSSSYSAGNSSAVISLPAGTTPVAQPQLCFGGDSGRSPLWPGHWGVGGG